MSLIPLKPEETQRGVQVIYMTPHALPTQNLSHADNRYGIVTGPVGADGWVPVRMLSMDPETKRWNGKYDKTDRYFMPSILFRWQAISNSEVDIILQEIGV